MGMSVSPRGGDAVGGDNRESPCLKDEAGGSAVWFDIRVLGLYSPCLRHSPPPPFAHSLDTISHLSLQIL